MERFGDNDCPALVAETDGYRVWQVRWPVLEGVFGEGLILEPNGKPAGYVVAIPDAGQTPEQIAGLAAGVAPESQFARWLVENRFQVVVPALIDRTDRWSGNPDIRMTNQPHREWIYRQAYQMGRHVIGYEVQKVRSVVDWFRARAGDQAPVGVAGYGEGGLIAFYSAAVDTRIDTCLVSGYFGSRQRVWEEPIYRNVWALLDEFGDAEIASLVAPRTLIVEYGEVPAVEGPPPPSDGRRGAAPGKLDTPSWESVRGEFDRIDGLVASRFQRRAVYSSDGETIGPGSLAALSGLAESLGRTRASAISDRIPRDRREGFDPASRQQRQVKQLENHVQQLVRNSEHVRDQFFLYKVAPQVVNKPWNLRLRHETISADDFARSAREYRDFFWEEVLGKIDEPLLEPNPRTRRIYDRPKWTGYDVVLDTWPELFAWGVLLVPRDLAEGERRPVVVCQHGRNGLPENVIEGDSEAYRNFAARLADRGFVVFAPHNLYRGEDVYRWLDRKANNVKASMFSLIIGQHDQILRWLGSLPFVDAGRIAFYGLSYGGETAVRVPPILDGYCLSICSGDFNEWVRKVAATDQPFSFMFTVEWEMPYFNHGNTLSYAEMAYLMVPRPFMVERGHHDGVGRDSWVAHEYAKVRWLYAQLGLADKTEIEFFNGGHTINGQGTFDFLHKHLDWPKPE
jgi:dienelactone hydrolase